MKKIIIILICLFMFNEMLEAQLPNKIKKNSTYTTSSGLQIKFLQYYPKNTAAKSGCRVSVNYVGKLLNDTVFDSSYKRGKAFSFVLGEGSVIKGWEEGIAYMHEGDSAILTIPPELGYGATAKGTIPANSTLVFNVVLEKVSVPFDTKGKDTVKTASGLEYIVVSKGRGIKVDSGMNVTVHYTGYFEDGSIFDSSVERDEPISIPIGTGKVIKGWDEGITYLSVGDKARLFIPYGLAYGEAARGPIPAKSNLIFDVEIIKAEKIVSALPYDVKGKDTIITASGLKYIKVQESTGKQAVKGNTVKVHYTGYFTNGKMFDSSVERGEAFEFELGAGKVIKGWDEGIALLKVGEKARLIVPYTLGYGVNDFYDIPGKSTLIFDVELLDAK
jgi:peptidylprolyl isomerase